MPVDLRVYHALSKSPLAMDIYTWLTYRMFVLRASGKRAARIPWVGLMKQLGANYADSPEGLRAFRFQFRKRLREVLLFYLEAHGHVKDEGTHLMLTPANCTCAARTRCRAFSDPSRLDPAHRPKLIPSAPNKETLPAVCHGPRRGLPIAVPSSMLPVPFGMVLDCAIQMRERKADRAVGCGKACEPAELSTCNR